MKLFLSSAGLSNKTLINSFENLVGEKGEKVKIAFIPTAANVESGDKDWLISDYTNLKKQNYIVDIVDISAVEKEIWLPRIQEANVLFLGGGNTFHLMHWVEKSGLKDLLPELLKTKVYAGISAGSCIAGPTIYNSVQNLFGEKYNLKVEKGLGLVDFQFIPHLNSKWFPKINEDNLEVASKELKESVYACDDNSVVVINENNIEVISEGKWRKFN